MPAAALIRIKDWGEFVRLDDGILHGSAHNLAFYFRGQAREEWSLEPSLVRIAQSGGWSASRTLAIEQAALKHFVQQAHLYLPTRMVSEPNDPISWWMIMQHHGAPTRLLDWTSSLFVAAYFAVEQHPSSDGAIWMFRWGAVVQTMSKHPQGKLPVSIQEMAILWDADAPSELYFPVPYFQTDRMAAQQTVLTLSPQVLSDHRPIIETSVPDKPKQPRFVKIIIPAGLKLEFLRKLRSMNITARTLFPGIDGLGRSIRELALLAGPE